MDKNKIDVHQPEHGAEDDRKLLEALQRLSNDADGMPSLAIERRMARASINLLQDSHKGLDGNVAIFYQWRQKCDHHLSRSCAVRVNDIDEILGLFKEFFELGSCHESSCNKG